MSQVILHPTRVDALRPDPKNRFFQLVCEGCRKGLGEHWYLPFKTNEKRSQFYCHRDGTSHAGNYHKQF